MKTYSTKKLVYISLLVGLSILLTRVFSIRIPMGNVEGVRLGFGALPIIFGSFFLGPLSGGLIGAISDLLGYFINPMGPYMPHFTLTSFFTGVIPGFIFIYVFNKKMKMINLLICISIGQIITSVLAVPFFIDYLFGIPFKTLAIPRLISQIISVPIYSYFIKVVNDRAGNLIVFNTKTKNLN